MTKKYTPQEILALPMEDNDAGAATIGQYFSALLNTLFIQTEGFSGKRPFGNSGWDRDVDKALVRADAIWGEFDEDGFLEDYDGPASSAIVFDTIAFLSKADWTTLAAPKPPLDWIVVALNPIDETVEATVGVMLDEESAKSTAEQHNSHATVWKWVALHVPK